MCLSVTVTSETLRSLHRHGQNYGKNRTANSLYDTNIFHLLFRWQRFIIATGYNDLRTVEQRGYVAPTARPGRYPCSRIKHKSGSQTPLLSSFKLFLCKCYWLKVFVKLSLTRQTSTVRKHSPGGSRRHGGRDVTFYRRDVNLAKQ